MNDHRSCECGRNAALLIFRDNLLPREILLALYCPRCRGQAVWDGATMLEDCGWVLEYDVAGAQAFLDRRGLARQATPEFLFYEDYLSWQGLAPGDQEIKSRMHQRLAPLIEQDLALYLKSLKSEWLAHVAQLKAAGWRKAQLA
jgi:hypothetical protein